MNDFPKKKVRMNDSFFLSLMNDSLDSAFF